MRGAVLALLAALTVPAAAAQDRLSDLRQFYGMAIGPYDFKSMPGIWNYDKGGPCRCHDRCTFATDRYGTNGVDSDHTPGNRCGLGNIFFYRFADTFHGKHAAGEREFVLARNDIVRRYGRPTYFSKLDNWTRYQYCTDAGGRLLRSDELRPGAEIYAYTFQFDRQKLDSLGVAWTDSCSNVPPFPPIP